MKKTEHKTVYRKDYQPSPYLIDNISLTFKLHPLKTIVVAETHFFLNNEGGGGGGESLFLNGEDLTLVDIAIDDKSLPSEKFRLEEKGLTILDPAKQFTLRIVTEINPEGNTALSGLYRSSNNYCTQCEAEGFRRITYYIDRPDVLATFTTRIEADKDHCPVLLSNGNLTGQGDLPGNGHYCSWHDPFPKPCYLFALVAGDLACIEDKFVTMSKREIALRIFVEHKNKNKCGHAMVSLKKAMKWDEEVFGLEYDLDTYMVVAVDDFNMGAMENKGLNIFNSKYVLASPNSAEDRDYVGIESVIAHEYFHNWTGNRVTCRDWFQLSLKEGLTVYRDQEFSADMNSRPVQRISAVKILRSAQFREDSGPMAHPVRPDSYVEINNFYTVTVYNKGAEVVRMLAKTIGLDNFKKGLALYFNRYDGQAVTCDDFVGAMEDVSGIDLKQFKLWYSQAGTPELQVSERWEKETGSYILDVTQKCGATPGQPDKQPFQIPIEIGLLERQVHSNGGTREILSQNHMLELKEVKQTYTFSHFKEKPVLSFLRDFTAPVKITRNQSTEELCFLMANDDNPFNRWESAFTLSVAILKEIIKNLQNGKEAKVDELYIEAFASCLKNHDDVALTAHILTLPDQGYLAQQITEIEPKSLFKAVHLLREKLVSHLRREMLEVYRWCDEAGEALITPEAIAKRSLKNCCLHYLMTPGVVDSEAMKICLKQFDSRKNMTDVIAALTPLSHIDSEISKQAMAEFYEEWRDDALVMDKWLALQAGSSLPSTLSTVKKLLNHQIFSIEKPNKVRALIGTFCFGNHYRFHDESGAGYRFLTQQILRLDKINPQIAARMMTPFVSHSKYTMKLRVMMEEQIRFILAQKGLSEDVYEIAMKSIKKIN